MSGSRGTGRRVRGWLSRRAGMLAAVTVACLVAGAAGTGDAFAVCGDIVVDAGEACDLGSANGQAGSCCSASCQYEPTTTVCRPAAQECDQAETCDGANPTCPPNLFVPDGMACTDDGLFCTGTEVCLMGMCLSIDAPMCNDGDSCTADYCDEMIDACSGIQLPDTEQAYGPDGVCDTLDDNMALYGADQSCGTGDDGVGDGVCLDNCSAIHNPDQRESDRDGVGDSCDTTPCRLRAVYMLSSNILWRVVPGTQIADLAAGSYLGAKDVAIDPTEATAFVTDNAAGSLVVLDLPTRARFSVFGPLGPWGVDLDTSGAAWVTERSGGRISKVVGGMLQSGVITGLSEPTGIDVNDAGTEMFFTEFGSGELSRVSTMGGTPVLVTAGLSGPIAVELGPMEAEAYVLEATSGILQRVNLASALIEPVIGGLVNPQGMTLNAAKTHAYVTDMGGPPGTYLEVNLANGFTTIRSAPVQDLLQSGAQLGPKPPVILSIPDNEIGHPGMIHTAVLSVDDVTGREVYSADVTVRWNPDVLTAIDVYGGSLTTGCTVGSNTSTPGQAIISIFCSSPMTGAGAIVNMNLQVIGGAGRGSPIQIAAAVLNEGSPLVCTDDGSMFTPVHILGQVLYYRDHVGGTEPSTRPVDSAIVDLRRQVGPGLFESTPFTSYATSCSGHYLLSGLMPVRGYRGTPRKSGDFQTAVDPFDASLNAQHVLGLTTLTPRQRMAADASNNGTLSSFDSSLIARLSVGLIAQLPVAVANGSDWAFIPVPQAEPNQSVAQPVPTTGQQGSIAFTPLVEDADNQDYLAILYGDVSGNWQPVCPMTAPAVGDAGTLHEGRVDGGRGGGEAGALSAGPRAGGGGAEALSPDLGGGSKEPGASVASVSGGRLVLPDLAARTGQTVSVPVRAEGVAGALSFYLDLRHDPKVLTLTGVQAGAAASRFTLTPNNGEAGRSRLALYGSAPMGADGDVVVLTFRVSGKAGARSKLELSAWTVNEGNLPVSVTQGSVRVDARRSPPNR